MKSQSKFSRKAPKLYQMEEGHGKEAILLILRLCRMVSVLTYVEPQSYEK